MIKRRTEFQLEKAREREHVLQGLLLAIEQLDAVIATIRASESATNALELLQGTGTVVAARLPANSPAALQRLATANPFTFTEVQARAILDMQLRRLAALERQALLDEYEALKKKIEEFEDLLANPHKIDLLIRDDMTEMKKKYGDKNPRRTEIVEADAEDFREEDLVAHQDSVITLSIRNYIKRMPLEEFRAQRRGGKGAKGAPTREEDAVMKLVVCDTHDNLLFFTDRGKVYHLRGYDIPDTKKQAKGLPVVNLIEVDTGERVTTILVIKDYSRDFILLATRLGEIKKTALLEFAEVRRNGKIAMRLDDGDSLIAARVATDDTNVLLVSSEGQAIRFKIDDLRQASRTSGGVRGMRLPKGGYVVGVETLDDGDQLLIISETGSGKRTPLDEYRITGRGGMGVKTLHITERTGKVAACRIVSDSDALELMLVTREGIVVRTRINQIRVIGRVTQGVRVIDVNPGDQVASIAAFTMADEPERAPRDEAMDAMNGVNNANGNSPAATGTTRGVAPNGNLRLALDLDEETGEILDDADEDAEADGETPDAE